MTPKLENIIVQKSSENMIKEEAIEQGMITMKQDGIAKSLQGIISFVRNRLEWSKIKIIN